jgi:phospho-N-acetylmuramoyl-pentapeptide-transferase
MFNLVLVFLAAVLAGAFLSIPVLWFLLVFRVGQAVREEGPKTHKKKAGTPTMGGIAIVLTVLTLMFILINVDIDIKYASLIILFIGYALIGSFDDAIKIKNAHNAGLSATNRLFAQMALSLAFGGVLLYLGFNEGVSGILKDLHFNLPLLYLPLSVFIIVGAANAVNLTDGLDGLASGVLTAAFLALGVVAYQLQFFDEAVICLIAAGASFSFLRVNFYPAEVFMGDVGSLSLGALLAGVALLIHKELLLAVIGGVFVLETLSVMLQVSSFKLFKKRIFKMSPLHHHFELLGMPEIYVVLMFYACAAIFAGLGIWLSYIGAL